ncbi:alpha/beta-Hydrolases superfamily protein [Thalictrum thalictroides]|uniref:Alpha/beta-Hydrolases superfamily protein n=1 Tax=Thalictrum thalictroides TaxID=46969 RepID=A0A7J6V3N0_THATH|nr:alpha/beta-Hydrolases superfamily protein [Thalictrum thalictroides]
MERFRWLKVVILLWMLAVSGARELKVKDDVPIYNHTLAKILVEYSSAVYMSDLTELFTWTCDRCNDLTKGFEMLELIVDVQHCLQAFVGVAQDLNAIVVAFRGTQEHSIQNWIEDLFWKQLDLNYPGMPDAMVHHGFHYAYHNTTIRPGVLNAVKRGKMLYGDIPVMVTGHSMGGAMASFCALDLVGYYEFGFFCIKSLYYTTKPKVHFKGFFTWHVALDHKISHQRKFRVVLANFYPSCIWNDQFASLTLIHYSPPW